MSLTQHINHLCVLNGDYKILKKDLQNETSLGEKVQNGIDKLNELIEFYKINLQQQGHDECFQLVHSNDGSELFGNLFSSFGLTSVGTDSETNLNNLNEILSSFGSGAQQYQRLAIQHFNNNNNNSSCYICFIISDFDQTDPNFLKLEDIQLKLTNFVNSINNSQNQSSITSNASSVHLLSTSNMSLIHNNQSNGQQKRFMIYGWPVLYYCIKNDLVSVTLNLN
ncbi:hypothetical protein BpHYR1_011384 [Brachionus plicatilis]|uniref:Uncharacterized protein n=1 Tax=Brachionus plicatilis TaxID=10195 RepID=A0A3M7T567_BRAPC|nr:hypothetical protein BpHYR1_011384 [Brachionus plicatilis]